MMKQISRKWKQIAWEKYFVFSLLFTLMAGCAPGSYGLFSFKTEVDEIFESGRILEDHSYYYIGPDAEPVAIIAVNNKYSLAPSLWKEIQLTAEQLQAWNSRIDNRYRRNTVYRGAEILDQDNNMIGLWYSYLDWTVVKIAEGNSVIIFTPDTTKQRNSLLRGRR